MTAAESSSKAERERRSPPDVEVSTSLRTIPAVAGAVALA
jgi:hypothetical protein